MIVKRGRVWKGGAVAMHNASTTISTGWLDEFVVGAEGCVGCERTLISHVEVAPYAARGPWDVKRTVVVALPNGTQAGVPAGTSVTVATYLSPIAILKR